MGGRKRESRPGMQCGRRISRWKLVQACRLAPAIFISLAASPPLGLARSHRAPDSSGIVIVRVYNHVRLPSDVLSAAERETDSVFRSAGIETKWIDCPVNGEPSDAYPACRADFGPADFVMKIISPEMAAKYSWPSLLMGYAVTNCTPDLKGCWAAVSYRRVQDLALKADVSPALVLGKAMAHELGHLLLGPGHSDTGIMRAQLDDGDFSPGRLPSLVFLVAQRERLGATLTAVRATISTAR